MAQGTPTPIQFLFTRTRLDKVNLIKITLNNARFSLFTSIDELTDTMTAVSGGGAERLQDPVRIIHKDQDIISAFCINSVI